MKLHVRMVLPTGELVTYEGEWHREGIIALGKTLQAEGQDLTNQAIGIDIRGDAIRVRPFKGHEKDFWERVTMKLEPLK